MLHAAIVVMAPVATSILCRARRTGRAIIYGGLSGIAVIIALCMVVAAVRNEWPFNSNKVASHAAMEFARAYAFPVGGTAGGLAALLARRWMD